MRLGISLVVGMIGGVGMWSVVVALPAVQTEFGVGRSSASLPYTLTMVGLATGNVLLGRAVDRVGMAPLILGAGAALGIGYTAAGLAGSLTQFTLAQGLLIAMFGAAATFGPLMADVSHWFRAPAGPRGRDLRRRQLLRRHDLAAGRGVWHRRDRLAPHPHPASDFSASSSMSGLSLLVRRRPETARDGGRARPPVARQRGRLRVLHGGHAGAALRGRGLPAAWRWPCRRCIWSPIAAISATGRRAAREMLSLMFAFGIVSRISSGFIADRIGGLRHAAAGVGAADCWRCCSTSASTGCSRST